jgi:type IV pilus assembly protein PilA
MFAAIRKRLARKQEEGGFTLIELMVVVLIIAILIAIAIPTFLGARQRAQNRAAQSSLRNALTSAKTIYTDNQDYSQATTTALSAAEPSLTFSVKGTASTGPNNVSLDPNPSGGTTSSTWVGAVLSKSGKCYAIKDDYSSTPAGTSYATVTGACSATNAETATFSQDVSAGWTS